MSVTFTLGVETNSYLFALFSVKNLPYGDEEVSSLVDILPKEVLDFCNNDLSTLDDTKLTQFYEENGFCIYKHQGSWILALNPAKTSFNLHFKPHVDCHYLTYECS